MIFGCAPTRLSGHLRTRGFTEKDCDEVIDSMNLQLMIKDCKEKHPEMNELDIKYLICATFFANTFFKAYPGLQARIEREQEFALKNGYVRSWQGPIRHLPEFRYFNIGDKGFLNGTDKKLYSKLFSGLKNIACNSTIQTLETYHAFPDWHCIMYNLEKWGFKSWIWNGVHDSLDMYIYKPELRVVLALINKCATTVREPDKGIPITMDGDLSDLSTVEGQEKYYYKKGKGVNILDYDINVELDKWNKKHKTNLVYEDVIPR